MYRRRSPSRFVFLPSAALILALLWGLVEMLALWRARRLR